MNNWTPDDTQRQIIEITEGCHLVLAPPGCGKTQILAERIHLALTNGVKPEDMLCLTFTNRAARGMRDRINERVGQEDGGKVFVGNVHRFCSFFLFSNNIVPAESAIIDDDTTNSILARYLNEDEERVGRDFRRKKAYQQIMFFSHFMYDIEHGLPKALRMHPECVTREDIAVMKAIAETQRKKFDASLMLDIYEHSDFYLDLINQPPFAPLLRHEAEQTLMKMRYAHAYTAYKRLNNLLDFEDLLQLTYTALKSQRYKCFHWIQVDEVQDLNMLQLAIIYQLSGIASPSPLMRTGERPVPCLLFLGDEQQAIFSFMGAKLTTLNALKDNCKGNIHHLGVNHRSPKQLLEMLNTYAVSNLKSDPALLPYPSREESSSECEMAIKSYENIWAEFNGVAKYAAKLVERHADENTAIIVNSNNDADEISKALDNGGHDHFKISGTDIFSTREVKLLLSHLSVLHNDHNFLAWSQVMSGLRICETPASARQFVHQLRKIASTPSDFLGIDAVTGMEVNDGQTCLQRFINTYETQDIIVFDTETTGLDVFQDDIIQIAAERIRQGKSIAKFSVYIETDREIPQMLGDIVNPIIEEREHQHIYTHEEGLGMFLAFADGLPLLAHNAAFDIHILKNNLKRYNLIEELPQSFDSLRLIRLLRPDLKAFKLKILLHELGLEGENSHLADDDVNATVSLVNYCYEKGKEVLPLQKAYLSRKNTISRLASLQRNYKDFYQHGIRRLYAHEADLNDVPVLVNEMRFFYHGLEESHWIKPVSKIDYIFRYLAKDVIDGEREPTLKEQLDNHIMEISTFKEADLCGSATMEDRLFVSTIHKAKGLEFDNVFVFDVVDGRIPNYYNENNPAMLAEDARKLYVAMSRAKKRLYICYSLQSQNTGMPQRKLSRFMEPVKSYFKK